MKLSEIKGERTIDVIADIIEPISNIASDKENTAGLFEKIKPPQGLDEAAATEFAKKSLMERVKKYASRLLKSHKGDIVNIFSIIEGVDREEYCKTLTLPKLIANIIELLTDEIFQETFTFARSATGETSSPSAPENTGEVEA